MDKANGVAREHGPSTYDRIKPPFLCFAASFCVLLSGCAVGPDYTAPEVPVPDAWHQALTEGATGAGGDLHEWWSVFGDPVLTGLVERARQNNLTVRIAVARIDEARARFGVTSGQYAPTLDATGFYSRDRASENGPLAAFGGGDQSSLHSIGLDATWEIDVFGRIRRSVEAAQASLDASIEDYRDVLVSLYAEVALNYIQVRALEERIELARENIQLQTQTLRLTGDRYKAELVPQLDVRQAELNLATTESFLPTLEGLRTQGINRLAVLLGLHPGSLEAELSVAGAIPSGPGEFAVGLPAELLRQRPDIRRAERQLAAQTAQIGVATSALYPAFSLSGTFALEATNIADVADSGSRTYGFTPFVRWNLFDGNRIRSAIDVEEARTEQSLLQYEQTVLLALEEVEAAMVAYVRQQQRRRALARSVVASRKSVELVTALYRSGLTDFQNVLDMQRTLTQQEDQLAESQGAVVQNLVLLYKALGGGWAVQ